MKALKTLFEQVEISNFRDFKSLLFYVEEEITARRHCFLPLKSLLDLLYFNPMDFFFVII